MGHKPQPTGTQQRFNKSSRQIRRDAERLNQDLWEDIYHRLFNFAVNIFEWKGLPKSVDTFNFESLLLQDGHACMIYETTRFRKFLSLSCVPASIQNLYYENSYWRAIGARYNEEFMAITHYNADVFRKFMMTDPPDIAVTMKGVVCFDNYTDYAMDRTIQLYTDRLCNILRTIDTVLFHMKHPYFISCDQDTSSTIKNVLENMNSNVPALLVTSRIKQAMSQPAQVQNTNVDASLLPQLWNSYNNTINDFLTAMGVNNIQTNDKKERLLTDEVNANNQFISANMEYRRSQREHFIENVHAAFDEDFPGVFKGLQCEPRKNVNELAQQLFMPGVSMSE